MNEKTIAERLREVKANRVCSGSFIGKVLNGKEAGCKDLYGEAISCSRCAQLWANKLADAIEAEQRSRAERNGLPEGIEWPRFEDGEPVKFGDEFVDGNGYVHKLHDIHFYSRITHLNAVDHRLKYGESVKRPEPEAPDTQEDIDADCLLDAKDYCEKHGIKTEYPKHHGKAKCEHLLRRQRKLMGGE